jgi:NAD(P)-dependent dehydrogenase (short-subunit alcohol dehydrogenase family)
VLITGASKGIGKATDISYAIAGASGIALAARSSCDAIVKDVKEAAKNTGRAEPNIIALKLDVTDRDEVDAAVKAVSAAFGGRLDVLVNNAGYLSAFAGIPDSDPDEWWRDWEVNVKGLYLVTHAFWLLLLKSNLKLIINMASIGATVASPLF